MATLTAPLLVDGQALCDLTSAFLDRALGAANDISQRVYVEDRADRRLFFGRLIHEGKTRSGSEYVSKNAPCSYIAYFSVANTEPIRIVFQISFNVYVYTVVAKNTKGEPNPTSLKILNLNADPANANPDAGRSDMWIPWTQRLRPPSSEYIALMSSLLGEERPGESRILGKYDPSKALDAQIRKRYSQRFEIELGNDDKRGMSLDLEEYREQYAFPYGTCARWQGRIEVERRVIGTTSEITVLLTNTFQSVQAPLDPRWYDVHMTVHWDKGELIPSSCPILGGGTLVPVETKNCSAELDSSHHIISVSPIARTQTERQMPCEASQFSQASENSEMALQNLIELLKANALPELELRQYRDDCELLLNDSHARYAIQSISQVFSRATGDGSWYAHQLACLVRGAAKYVRSNNLEHLVLNVPTAGGKTEAFFSLCLFTSFYHLSKGNRSINIIKYPMTLLSRDQVARLAGYVMVADQIALSKDAKCRGIGIGYHVGRKDTNPNADTLFESCPYPVPNKETKVCGASWKGPTRFNSGVPETTCMSGHVLRMSIDREHQIVRHCPGVLISTWDKFVAQAASRRLGVLFGAPRYFCESHGNMDGQDAGYAPSLGSKSPPSKQCRAYKDGNKCNLSTKPMGAIVPGVLVFDEGHLIRESVGSLDSHFETALYEIVRENSGRYPLVVVSTATIARIDQHLWQLGIIKPNSTVDVLPKRQSASAFFKAMPGTLKHDIVGLLPVDTVINRALPELIDTFYETLRILYGYDVTDLSQKDSPPDNLPQVRQVMVYSSSYQNIFGLREMNANAICDQRKRRGLRELKESQLNRRYIDESSMNKAIEAVKKATAPIVYATNLASVGIDIGALDIVMFYGLPSNVSEFIQAMNRTGRRRPALCVAVLGPAKEREMSYYRYWESFIHNLDDILEPIPINRFAQNAIDRTFNNIATSVIVQQLIHQGRVNIWQNVEVLRALKSDPPVINEQQLLNELSRIYRVKEDVADTYGSKIRELWAIYKTTLEDAPRPEGISQVFQNQGGNWMATLRSIDRNVELTYSDPFRVVKQYSSNSTLSSDDEADVMPVINQEQEELESGEDFQKSDVN